MAVSWKIILSMVVCESLVIEVKKNGVFAWILEISQKMVKTILEEI